MIGRSLRLTDCCLERSAFGLSGRLRQLLLEDHQIWCSMIDMDMDSGWSQNLIYLNVKALGLLCYLGRPEQHRQPLALTRGRPCCSCCLWFPLLSSSPLRPQSLLDPCLRSCPCCLLLAFTDLRCFQSALASDSCF